MLLIKVFYCTHYFAILKIPEKGLVVEMVGLQAAFGAKAVQLLHRPKILNILVILDSDHILKVVRVQLQTIIFIFEAEYYISQNYKHMDNYIQDNIVFFHEYLHQVWSKG